MYGKKVWILAIGVLFSLFLIPSGHSANEFNWDVSSDLSAGVDNVYTICGDSSFAYFIGDQDSNIWHVEKRHKINGTTVANYTIAQTGAATSCTIMSNGTKDYLYITGGATGGNNLQQIDKETMLNVRNFSTPIVIQAVTNNGTDLIIGGIDNAIGGGAWHVGILTHSFASIRNYTSDPTVSSDQLFNLHYSGGFLYAVGGQSNNALDRIEKININTGLNLANATFSGAFANSVTASGGFVYVGHRNGIISKHRDTDLVNTVNGTFNFGTGTTNIGKLATFGDFILFQSTNTTHRNLTVVTTDLTLITSISTKTASGTVFGALDIGYLHVDNNKTVFTGGFSNTPPVSRQWDMFSINMSNNFLIIKAFNERNSSQRIDFDLTITNATCEFTRTDITEFISEIADAGICLGLTTISISNNSDGAFTWPSRNYIATLSSNTSTNLNAYLLRDDAGITHTFIVTTFADVPIENATVEIRRFIGSTFIPVASCRTDTSGTCSHFMDPTITYQVVVSANGYGTVVFTKQASVIATQTFVRLRATGSGGSSIINLTTAFEGITWSITPTNSIQNSTFNITFFISASNGDLSWFALNVTYRNVSNRTYPFSFVNITTSPTGGTIVVTINSTTNQSGWYDANATFLLVNQSYVQLPLKTYFLTNGTGVSRFDPFGGVVSIDSYRLVGLIALAISTAFFSKFGFFAGWLGGICIMAFLTLGLNIFPWEWLALTFLITFALFVLLRRI